MAGFAPIAILAVLVSLAAADPAKDLRELTGARTRAVWAQVQENGDEKGIRNHHYLVGFDTDDGKGERRILPEKSNYFKPLLSPDGRRIVYTDHNARKIYVVNFDGSGKKVLTAGKAACVRHHDGKDWVYARTSWRGRDDKFNDTIIRFELDAPDNRKVIWNKSQVDMDTQIWLSVSGDGKKAYATWPWGNGGMLDIETGTLTQMGGGCWPGIAPDNSYRWFMLRNGHRSFHIGDTSGIWMREGGSRPKAKELSVTPPYKPDDISLEERHPHNIYWPRFTNLPGFIVEGAPQYPTIKTEVWVGRIAESLDSIEAWVQITKNGTSEIYPDVWIEAGQSAQLPQPGFQPIEEHFSGTLEVTMSTPVGGVEIRYTTDNSNPGPSSKRYTDPIKLTQTTTVKARAYKAGSQPSAISAKTYTKVAALTFESISLTPASLTLPARGTAQFSAVALDQFGKAMGAQPQMQYSTDAPNRITSKGSFEAGKSLGAFEVRVSATISGTTRKATATVKVEAGSLVLLEPDGSVHYRVGDTVHVRWQADESRVTGVEILFSPDSGASWYAVSAETVTKSMENWGNYSWVIPASVSNQEGSASTLGGRGYVLIQDYFDPGEILDYNAKPFKVEAPTALLLKRPGNVGVSTAPDESRPDGRLLPYAGPALR